MAPESLEQRQARAERDRAHEARQVEAVEQERKTLDALRERTGGGQKAMSGPSENKASTPATETKDVNATDAAIALAKEEGVDLSTVKGTGEGGRITKADVQAAAE